MKTRRLLCKMSMDLNSIDGCFDMYIMVDVAVMWVLQSQWTGLLLVQGMSVRGILVT